METGDWILIASAFIIAAGWFVTGYLNRAQDVAQKRLEYRLEALKALLVVWFFIQKNPAPFTQPEFLPLLEHARSEIQLYGFSDEVDLMEQFIKAIQERDLAGANSAINELVPLARLRIREELRIPEHQGLPRSLFSWLPSKSKGPTTPGGPLLVLLLILSLNWAAGTFALVACGHLS